MITKPTKYTPEFVLQEVQEMLSEVRSDPNIFYLGQLFDSRDYSMQRYSEWRKKYTQDDEISEAIEKIGDMLETRVVVGAMKKELHPTITVFHLKNNFKWSDKVEEVRNRPLPIPIMWINDDHSSQN